jgi:DNA end-binding protein Ku
VDVDRRCDEDTMARPVWSGTISFGLVSVPVRLFTAVRSQDLRFRQINVRTHAPVKQRRVDADTGEEVPYDDIVKGWETPDGGYVLVDPDELSRLDPDASDLIDILDFVDLEEIDPIYFRQPYYLGPASDAAAKPYRLLTDAMERKGKVAIAKLVMRNKEHLAAIRAAKGVLVLSTMHFADEVLDPAESVEPERLEKAEPRSREVEMAEQLIESLATDFDPTAYRDEHRERVTEFLHAKAEGEEVELAERSRDTGEVVDLVAALEQSLERAGRDRPDRAERGDPAASGQQDYTSMTRSQLYDLAQERDIEGRSSMSKKELVAALEDSDAASGAA